MTMPAMQQCISGHSIFQLREGDPKVKRKKKLRGKIYAHTHHGHLPKHFSIEEVKADERNFSPADPPGK